MKQFLNILQFELLGYFKNKVFIWTTVILFAVCGIALYFPQIAQVFTKGEDGGEKEIVFLADNYSENKEATQMLFASAMPDRDIQLTNKNADELKALIDSEEYSSAIVIDGATRYSYIVKNMNMYDQTELIIDEVMTMKYRMDAMAKMGVSQEQISSLMSVNIEGNVIQTGKDQMQNFFYTYILIFALYMAIMMYGQLVATSVASEKSSRAMEVLITSAKPVNLMFGKIIGAGLAGLFQIVVLLASSFVFFNLNKSSWNDNFIINSIFNIPVSVMLYAVLFFVLGYFIYAFLYGAVGSLASKVEDINTSTMPITLLFVIAFIAVMFSMSGGKVDSVLMVVLSYVPLTSPMAMFVRITMGEVAAYEIIISVMLAVVSTVGIGYMAAKIYKAGVLLYGKPPKLSNVIKAMRD